jgi:ketosteroid isomerase-like protein
MANKSPVRQKIRVRDRQRRSLDERLMLRFPALARSISARVSRLPPSSWLRQRVLARSVSQGFAATKRGDWEVALGPVFYDPDCEWHATVGGIDEGRVYRGHSEIVEAYEDYFETWERIELRPEEIIDTGNQLVVLVHEVARGRESGITVETDTGTVSTLRDGRVVRVRSYMDRAQALEAAGIKE